MTPGTVVEVISGQWCGRIGEVEPFDPEWVGVAHGAVLLRLVAVGRRPPVERVVVSRTEVVVVDLRGTRH